MTNLILDQGATWVRIWTYQDSVGLPINLTGASAAFQARFGTAEGSLAFDLNTGAKGGVVLGGALGTITVTIADTLSSALGIVNAPQGACAEDQGEGTTRNSTGVLCVWAIELTIPGQVIRLDEGTLCITREVVR
jgi:hypothetical protein